MTQQGHPAERNLREEIVREAHAIIENEGLERLSMREVARRLGVSHQAPYKHFASREHILAEIIGRAFAAFADHLDRGPRTGTAHADMDQMGKAYLGYALQHPLNYRLMFGTPLPDPAQHPDMMAKARHAFHLLEDAIARLHREAGRVPAPQTVQLDALYVWATLHGLAGIVKGDTVHTLGLAPDTLSAAPEAVLSRIGGAFGIHSG